MSLFQERTFFNLPDNLTYLNCAAMSPQLRSVTEAGLEAVRQKERPWEMDWFAAVESLREAVARLLAVETNAVAMIPSVSYGIAIAAANVRVREGEGIVILGEQFPSNVYAWRELARAKNARLVTVQKGPSDDWTAAVLDAIDEDTAVVSVPNCHWTDGALVDLVEVGKRARDVGAALVVDASQSLGAYPIDVAAVQPDFLVSVGYKWLMGPFGLGYLYAAPRWHEEGRPIEESWLTRSNAKEFDALVNYTDAYREGAGRFDMGEYPQMVHAPMAHAAVSQILDWGVERIQTTLGHLTDLLAEETQAMGCTVLPPEKRVGHMLGIRFPDGIPDALPGRLQEERVIVSVRGDAVRVSPHVYNGEEDVERFLDVLREAM